MLLILPVNTIHPMRTHRLLIAFFLVLLVVPTYAQQSWNDKIEAMMPEVLLKHRDFSSIPNVASNAADMQRNIDYVQPRFEERGFSVKLLESSTLPIFLAEKEVDPEAKTILFYFHLDGQAVNPENWDQEHPFTPVLKAQGEDGNWQQISWNRMNEETINPEWRIFGRAAADDKGPITMMLTALELLEAEGVSPAYNVKILLDLQEEAGSDAFLSTLNQYREDYAADYMIIMDGPAHNTNKPTLTFGCRGIATCSITVYGAKLPQHSGHYGNYSPNPVFMMSHLLASMKNEAGRVTIDGYYNDINLTAETRSLLAQVPDNEEDIKAGLGIHQPDEVGKGYQEALQYPSLNVRHIETSWKGPGLKTIIPEWVTAHIDVRLVAETDGAEQLQKIKAHIEQEGYLLLNREPTDEERMAHRKIVKFNGNAGVNAFRTSMNAPIGQQLIGAMENYFGEKPVSIRSMGGTVPIIPAVNTLGIPAIIVPMVNMDNNQHNPNENLRVGNMIQGIQTCVAILTMELN